MDWQVVVIWSNGDTKSLGYTRGIGAVLQYESGFCTIVHSDEANRRVWYLASPEATASYVSNRLSGLNAVPRIY